jgi:hypothetical protein
MSRRGSPQAEQRASTRPLSLSSLFLLTTNADVVALGGAANSGAEALEGSGTRSEGLLGTSDTARLLLAGLVEPGLNTPLPVLAEVVARKLVVVLHHCCCWVEKVVGRLEIFKRFRRLTDEGSW